MVTVFKHVFSYIWAGVRKCDRGLRLLYSHHVYYPSPNIPYTSRHIHCMFIPHIYASNELVLTNLLNETTTPLSPPSKTMTSQCKLNAVRKRRTLTVLGLVDYGNDLIVRLSLSTTKVKDICSVPLNINIMIHIFCV